MSKYIDIATINYISKLRDQIFEVRNTAFKQTGIDLLDNDVLSSISLYQIVNQYDSDFNVNFARNGEDGISNGLISEHKCSNVKPNKTGVVPMGSFQFHAMGKIDYPRYILFVRNKETLSIVRLYDISGEENVKIIVECLQRQSDIWLTEGKKDPKKMKRDVIYITEAFLKALTFAKTYSMIDRCEICIG
jgi:hypothetical protein